MGLKAGGDECLAVAADDGVVKSERLKLLKGELLAYYYYYYSADGAEPCLSMLIVHLTRIARM